MSASAANPWQSGRSAPAGQQCSPIVDLRQYTLYPSTRDAFVELFDRELVETQEAAGMRVIGQFRDLGDPNRFVWMRGFSDMPTRERALTAFYMHGSAWKAHGDAARSRMIDSTDAMLLHPAWPDAGFSLPSPDRRPSIQSEAPEGIVVATIHYLPAPVDVNFLDYYDSAVVPVLVHAGAKFLGALATEHSPNNFPRLPLREKENTFISFKGFGSLGKYHEYMSSLGRHPAWRSEIYPSLVKRLQGCPQVLRLAPTSRSQLRA